MPVRMFMSVDLPAPFSPSSAWISPMRRSRSMASLATRPGNVLVMLISSTTFRAGAKAAGAGAWSPLSMATASGHLQTGNALNRPIPVVESHVVHRLALGNADSTLDVLDLADERRIAAQHLGADFVRLLANGFRNGFAPGVAIDTLADVEENFLFGLPRAGEAILGLSDIEIVPID